MAVFSAMWYRWPSEKMIVIGVTGTSGKSSVVYILSQLLEKAGFRVGVASTIFFKIGKKEWVNDKKMTMVGRFALQNLLSQMAKANCHYAIIETTSEGIKQFRHIGINYDIAVFTTLYPEHIESHGSFENYKKEKLKLFTKLSKDNPKLIAGQKVNKVIISNLDNEHTKEVLSFASDKKYAFTTQNNSIANAEVVRGENIEIGSTGFSLNINHQPFRSRLMGDHNVYNSLAAISVGMSQGLSLTVLAKFLDEIKAIPGRIEFITDARFGDPYTIIVDYAFEPKAVEALYKVVDQMNKNQIIHVLGSAGGGRDKSRRAILGKIAGEKADIVIVTNEDPYDEDPNQIIDQVAQGAEGIGKVLDQNLFKIEDRRQAIKKALILAKKDDIVLITGKGSEQAIVVANNKKIPWDDRSVVREELLKLS
jgi:UDP-N-acetylmuramoyl-L-alanyl-D-glutamate--2,6-diaminopimelate ligase